MRELGVTANASTLLQLLQPGIHYRIPSFQRSYSWQVTDATSLLEDLLDGMNDERAHFLGAMVTVRTSVPNVLELVDGQQRLTTVSLILA